MTDEEKMLILLAGSKAFRYARENLGAAFEDPARIEATEKAFTGSGYCIES